MARYAWSGNLRVIDIRSTRRFPRHGRFVTGATNVGGLNVITRFPRCGTTVMACLAIGPCLAVIHRCPSFKVYLHPRHMAFDAIVGGWNVRWRLARCNWTVVTAFANPYHVFVIHGNLGHKLLCIVTCLTVRCRKYVGRPSTFRDDTVMTGRAFANHEIVIDLGYSLPVGSIVANAAILRTIDMGRWLAFGFGAVMAVRTAILFAYDEFMVDRDSGYPNSR